jgi:hypothetical protein
MRILKLFALNLKLCNVVIYSSDSGRFAFLPGLNIYMERGTSVQEPS